MQAARGKARCWGGGRDSRSRALRSADFGGNPFALTDAKQQKCVVVIFFGTECPLARLYALRLQTLANDYQSRGVTVVGINSNSQDSIADLAVYAPASIRSAFRCSKIRGPWWPTSSVPVERPRRSSWTSGGSFVFHGRIWSRPIWRRLHAARAKTTTFAAGHSMELLSGKTVNQPLTEPAGCLIGRARKPRDGNEVPVTFSKQISRIFNQHCVECHQPGEIGPFALTDYQEVARLGRHHCRGSRRRPDGPPWHANPKFGKFAGDRSLTAEEKRLIAAWAAAGAAARQPGGSPRAATFSIFRLASASRSPTRLFQLPSYAL